MESIQDYIVSHTLRGECNCGKCADRGTSPDPEGHTVNVGFFKVAAKDEPTAEEFKRLAMACKGEFADCDVFDGKEHGYMELGAWIGDQGLALQFMGLGKLLNVFQLLTPAILGFEEDDPLFQQMAGMGYVTVKAAA